MNKQSLFSRKLKNNKTVIVVSAILKDKRGNILILKRSSKNNSNKMRWQLPEGKIEFGESPEEAIIREVAEETGLHLQNLRNFIIFTHPMKVKGTSYHILRIVFKANWQGNIRLSEDHTIYKWINSKKIKHLPTIAGTKRIAKFLI